MKERPGDARKETTQQTASGPKHEERGRVQGQHVSATRSVSMPNPLKGLQLSLYPIIKEH